MKAMGRFLTVLLLSLPFFLNGQGLFKSDDLLTLSIECHFDSLFQFYRYEKKYQKTRIIVDGQEEFLKIRVRGNSRRTEEFCHYPPLLLNFKEKETSGTIFAGQNKLKLVTPCLENVDDGVQVISREFLAYKIYRIITDSSFRVRPVNVRYVDLDDGTEVNTGSFLIEDAGMMADRLGMTLLKDLEWPEETPDYVHSTKVSLFHFMIGNLDWYFPNHNMKILANAKGDSVAIPYDFDLSGFVSAPYAEPRTDYYQEKITDRYYLGHCRTREEFEKEFDYFRSKEDEIYNLIDSADWIPVEQRKEMTDYIRSFYALISDEEQVAKTIMTTCQSFQ